MELPPYAYLLMVLIPAESGMDIPKEPELFFKSTSSIVGPFDPIVIPKGSEKTDWEVELALVIGKKASYVSRVHYVEISLQFLFNHANINLGLDMWIGNKVSTP